MRQVTTPYPNADLQRLAEWTATMLDAAQGTAGQIGCSPAAVVAQAALESGWGRAAIGHNLFGIKADSSWHGARQLVTTREVIDGEDVTLKDWFRDYDTFADSIVDHFQFLRANSRYAKCFDPDNSMTDRQYFEALQNAGYATDPAYVTLLCGVLDTVNTFQSHVTIVPDGTPPAPARRSLLYAGCPDGPDITVLQSRLGIATTGHYDVATMAAVEKFQASHRLTVDGIVGDFTWGVINALANAAR